MTRGAEELLSYLRAQRWFGEKGRQVRSAEIVESIPVRWPDDTRTFVIARARVVTDDGTSDYQLFLREGDHGFSDALDDEAFQRGLVHAFATGASENP